MTAIATRGSIAVFIGSVLLAIVAVLLRSSAALTLASGLLIGLTVAWTLTLPLVRQLRGQRLEFAWQLGQIEAQAPTGTVVPGMPFRVVCTLRHRARHPVLLSELVPILPNDVVMTSAPPTHLLTHPRERNEMSFTLIAKATGRVVMQGMAATVPGPFGLFHAPLYFPHPLVVKVVPRAAKVRGGGPESMQGLAVERSGQTILRRHGGGTELRELRDLQPGDPYKSIAWKQSARAGRLLVREVEREVQHTTTIVLDVSGSMRAGTPGQRKLDFALELATVEARRGLDRGDSVGLITVDGRVLAHVQPDDGLRHMIAIYDALLGATEVVDIDLTDSDDDEVLALVGKYLRQQDGVDYAREGVWRRDAIVAHAARALINEPEPKPAIVAGDAAAATLRRFCRQRGIPLRYRADTRADGKGVGLARALRLAGGDTRMPRAIVVVTDFDGVPHLELLRKPLMLLRRLRHDVMFVFPEAAPIAALDADADRALIGVYRMHEARRVRQAREFLGKLGITLLVAEPGMTAATTVARAQRRRHIA